MSEKLPRAVAASADEAARSTDPRPGEDPVEAEGPITPRGPPPPSNPQSGLPARRRPKVGVRIPDDEVARPSPGTPPAPMVRDSIRPSPIIQINSPPRPAAPPRAAAKEEEVAAGAPTLLRGPARSPSERPAPKAPMRQSPNCSHSYRVRCCVNEDFQAATKRMGIPVEGLVRRWHDKRTAKRTRRVKGNAFPHFADGPLTTTLRRSASRTTALYPRPIFPLHPTRLPMTRPPCLTRLSARADATERMAPLVR